LKIDFEIEGSAGGEAARKARSDNGGRQESQQQQQQVQPIAMLRPVANGYHVLEPTTFERGRRHRGVAIG
jgi:hypothetical protein